jgi:SAM-dependent methyltransferase
MERQGDMERAQSQPDFARIYERVLVPAIFAPWASELIERARPIGPSARVLDLGCGTGIVARQLRDRLGGAARITGLDVNPGMLAVARELAPELDWREGNAMALPFDDGAFDLVLSQAMLMFPPDRAAAVREMHRVLAPGGRLVLSTWRPRAELPLHEALGQVVERHLGVGNDRRYSLGDEETLRALLAEAGFVDVRLEVVSRDERYTEFPVRLSAMATGVDLAALSEAEREAKLARVEADSLEVLRRFAVDGGYQAPSRANLVTARRAS